MKLAGPRRSRLVREAGTTERVVDREIVVDHACDRTGDRDDRDDGGHDGYDPDHVVESLHDFGMYSETRNDGHSFPTPSIENTFLPIEKRHC